ncbi:MAG: AraC family transcriptional regulator [Eubacteriales bacterium]|nr:AraC family transcriptional regulator [Eubacteriales bacterium]
MIENLTGSHETVNYTDTSGDLKLYRNVETESYPPHWHTPFELIMPISGTYHVLCADQEFHLKEQDILLICPNVLHELIAPPEGERLIFQLAFGHFDLREIDTITAMLSPAVLVTPEDDAKTHAMLCRLIQEICDEYESISPYRTTFIYGKFLELLGSIARIRSTVFQENQNWSTSRKKEYNEKFLNVCNYINEHFSEDLTLEQIASLSGFSKYHFSRLFSQYMNISFYKYLNQKRIDYAKTLLISQDYPILDVALASGFSCHTAFLRMFKLQTGYTPTEFRKLYNI